MEAGCAGGLIVYTREARRRGRPRDRAILPDMDNNTATTVTGPIQLHSPWENETTLFEEKLSENKKRTTPSSII